jgi:hypothetical protein
VAQRFVEGKADAAAIARQILRARLDAVLADAKPEVRVLADEIVGLVAGAAGRKARDLPGWTLVAVEADGSVTEERLDLD